MNSTHRVGISILALEHPLSSDPIDSPRVRHYRPEITPEYSTSVEPSKGSATLEGQQAFPQSILPAGTCPLNPG